MAIKKDLWILTALCAFLYLAGNNSIPLTNPDEVFYALSAREMTAKGDPLTPYIFHQPQFEKPIFIYWLLNTAVLTLGDTPFAARFFPAVFAFLGVLGLYALALIGFKDRARAFWSAVSLATAGFYFAMAKTVFTDMVFSVFILFSLLCFYMAFEQPERKKEGILGFYFFAALAALSKGPLGILIPELIVVLFLLYRRQLDWLRDSRIILGFLLCLAVALPWYIYMIVKYGNAFIHEFFYNDHWRRLIMAEHKRNDSWFFYPVSTLAGMFPWTVFVVLGIRGLYQKLRNQPSAFEHFILSWLIIVFFVFQCAHSKLTSYILPIFPALALLAGDVVSRHLANDDRDGVLRRTLLSMSFLVVLLGIAVVMLKSLYQKYVPSPMPGYFLSALLITWAGGVAILTLKNRIRDALGVLAVAALPFLLGFIMLTHDVEPHVSSYSVAQYLPRVEAYPTTLLCAKPQARGLRYFTGQDVAIFEINGNNYFSPHPIPILNTPEKIHAFLRNQKLTYAALKKSSYQFILSLDPTLYRVTILGKSGPDHVLKIEYLGKP